MKKIYVVIVLLTILSSCSTQSERQNEAILSSTSISEVTEYLKTAHPEDPKKHILEAKLIALKNKEWTKGAATAKPMEARPIIIDLPNNPKKDITSDHSELFKNLMTENAPEHQEKTKKLLNTMFNEDISSNEAIFLFKNKSNCNLVLKINGKKFYNLAVPALNENFLVVEKGHYTITTDICDVKYSTQKSIQKHLQLSISNPVYKNEEEIKTMAKNMDSKKEVKKTKKSKVSKKKI